MASYIPQISDQGLQTPTYQPDFSFLAANQQKKGEQYMSGLSDVASGYNAILSQPVTDEANRVKRDEYIKTAQDGLKKLSSTDLSLPSNVAQAESLYAPFWQDGILLQDIAYTKYSQGELGKLDSWKNSNDKDVRAQYNSTAADYIQQGLNKLKVANRDQSTYSRLQRREAVPFADIDADIDAAWKEEKQTGIDTTEIVGNQVITRHNGIQSKDAFKTYYLSKVGSKYDKQLYVTEAVRVQRAKDEILQQNPGLDERALNEHFAGEQMDKLDTMYRRNIGAYTTVVNEWAKKHDDLYTQIQAQPGKRALVDQAAQLQEYENRAKSYQQQATEYQDQYKRYGSGDKTNPLYHKTIQDIAEHPEDYLTGIQKEIMADNWAIGMSSMNTSTKVELSPGWQAYQTENDKLLDRQLRAREISNTARGQTLDWEQKTGRDLKGNILPGFRPDQGGWSRDIGVGTGLVNGIPDPTGGSLTGLATTDVAHLALGLDKIEQIQAENMARVNNGIFDTKGIAASLRTDGVEGNTIIDFTEGAKNQLAGQLLTRAQQDATDQVFKVLQNNGIPRDSLRTTTDIQNALLKYSAIAAGKLLNSGNTKMIEQGKNLIMSYLDISENRDKVLANKRAYDSTLAITILTDKTFDKLTITNPDKTKRHITPEDMAQDFPAVQLGDNNGNPIRTVSPLEFAKLHASGDMKEYKGGRTLTLNGKTYNILSVNGIQSTAFMNGASEELSKILRGTNAYDRISNSTKQPAGGVYNRYGTPESFSNLEKLAVQTVVPKLQEYKNGLIVQNIGWDPDNKAQEPFATGLSKELANPSITSTEGVYQKVPGDTKPEVVQAIRNIIGSKEEMKDYTSGPKKTIAPDGTEAYEYTFKTGKDNDKTVSGNIKIKDLEGKTFTLPVTPGANTPYLRSIPASTGTFVHSELLYSSDPIVSDPIIQSSGYRSIVKAFAPVNGKNTKCSIQIQKCIPDIKNPGQTKWVNEDETQVDLLTGPRAKTPDEVVGMTNALLVQHLSSLVSQAKVKEQNVPAVGPALN